MKKKIIVVYYSRTGKSKLIAEELSRKLNCDIEEIKTHSNYNGFLGYMRALNDVLLKKEPKINQLKKLAANYDLVVIGGPIWGSSVSGPIRSYLTKNKDYFSQVACFITQGGTSGKQHYLKQVKQIINKKPIGSFAVSERDFKNESYKKFITKFISDLNIPIPKAETKDYRQNISV
ncbi:MAG: hypothetical protein WA160_04860 [Pseudobdellovibrio sp.]